VSCTHKPPSRCRRRRHLQIGLLQRWFSNVLCLRHLGTKRGGASSLLLLALLTESQLLCSQCWRVPPLASSLLYPMPVQVLKDDENG